MIASDTAGNAATAVAAPPARSSAHSSSSGTFATVSALGAAFAGIVTHSRNPDLLAVAMAVGITFFGAFVALHVLQFVFHVCMQVVRIAVPVAIVLLIGCALDWPWAEAAAHWLTTMAGHGVEAAARAITTLQTH